LAAPTFYVVPGAAVKDAIDDNRAQVFDVLVQYRDRAT
jgi:hypothetical protein